jgi:hypothetical protein
MSWGESLFIQLFGSSVAKLLFVSADRILFISALKKRKKIQEKSLFIKVLELQNLAGSDFIAAIRAARKDKLGVLADAGRSRWNGKHPSSLNAVAFSRRATRFVRSLLSMTYSRREAY